jgi:hypothetical protein
MKVRKREGTKRVPRMGQFCGAVWEMDGAAYKLCAVDLMEMDRLKEKGEVDGIPFCIAIDFGKCLAHLYPRPAIGGELSIDFLPPMIRI